VFADIVVIVAVVVVPSGGGLRRSGMAVWASSTEGAMTGKEGGAHGRCRYEGMTGGSEEGREGEGWRWVCGCGRED
jgi:hypothetical protein